MLGVLACAGIIVFELFIIKKIGDNPETIRSMQSSQLLRQ